MMIITGIIVIIAIVAAFMLFSSGVEDLGNSKIDIIGNSSIPENGTLNVKLENGEGIALKNKDIAITIKNSKGKVIFNKTVKTYVNGVANVKLTNMSAGDYDVNATFAGDDNYTSCSVSEKIKIVKVEGNEEPTDDAVDDTTDTADTTSTQSSQSHSSRSYQSQSYTPTSSSDDGGSEDNYYDENGNEMDLVIDEDGNEVSE